MNSVFGFRQFRLHGCLSYVIYDRASRQAMVVDPHFGLLEDYRSFLAENKLDPEYVVDTELFSDQFSASHVFRAQWDAEVAMSGLTASSRVTRKLKSGDVLDLGTLKFVVLETPGHAPDAIVLHEQNRGILLSGNTLLIGGSGRADYDGGSPEVLFQSLHEVILPLPETTLVFPSRDSADHLFSTLAVEKTRNTDLFLAKAEFVEKKLIERFPLRSEEALRCYEYNRQANPGPEATRVYNSAAPGPRDTGSHAKIGVEKYQSKLAEKSPDTLYLDVREPDEFAEARIPGTVNIPLSDLAFRLDEILAKKRIYVSCLSGRRATMAAQTLGYLGHPDVVNVSGGFQAWVNAGLPVEKS